MPTRGPAWERTFDIAIGTVALVILSPILLIAALAIKLVSNGPVIYKQRRIGYFGRPFMVYKFRTMHTSASSELHQNYTLSLIRNNQPMQKLDDMGDNRLIPFGRLMRAAGIDELPQLINVFKGEMSLAGPRPCIPAEHAAFSPLHLKRIETLPGLTGLWQVSGKNQLTYGHMIELDLKYVEDKTPGSYLKILASTPAVLIQQVFESWKPIDVAHIPTNASLLSTENELARSNIALEHA